MPSEILILIQKMLYIGKISRAVVSSTNLILNFQFFITVNRITPSFVASDMPPLRDFQSDKKVAILTACPLSIKNALIQLTSTGSILEINE